MSDRRQRALIPAGRRLAGLGAVGHCVEQSAHGKITYQGPLVGIHEDAIGCQRAVGHAAPVSVVQSARHLLEDAQAGGELEGSARCEHARE